MAFREPLEARITRLIVENALRDWASFSSVDVVVVGAGPAGLTAARYLAKRGLRVVVFEKRLGFGGGIGGGGMLFHKVVVEEEALPILREFNVRFEDAGGGLYVVDTAELVAKLAAGALDAGAKIVLGVVVEDVIYRTNPLRVTGVAVQWYAVNLARLHVDPLLVYARAVLDATGHDAEVLSVAARKLPELGIVVGEEKSAYSELGEKLVVEETGRVAPGLYAAGMSVAAWKKTPRMGPIFGGMLLSGRRVAEIIASDLAGEHG